MQLRRLLVERLIQLLLLGLQKCQQQQQQQQR
jgi:hypothetical protein